ncbi:MAG: histidine phosphatase family protein [Acidobacteria bacterium]|nr:histidine phosphatase family protein [Acidobacteriota bacterium]
MIVLVHHAEAVGPEVDPMRPLSAAGRAAAARLAADAAARGVRPDAIWHSGKVRARQTAELFGRACQPLARLSAVRGLQPDDPPRWIRDELDADDRAIVIVGHMPHLNRLLHLLRGDAPGAEFPPHGCVALERAEAGWTECWRLD